MAERPSRARRTPQNPEVKFPQKTANPPQKTQGAPRECSEHPEGAGRGQKWGEKGENRGRRDPPPRRLLGVSLPADLRPHLPALITGPGPSAPGGVRMRGVTRTRGGWGRGGGVTPTAPGLPDSAWFGPKSVLLAGVPRGAWRWAQMAVLPSNSPFLPQFHLKSPLFTSGSLQISLFSP